MKSLVKGTLFGWSLPRINHYWGDPPQPPRLCTLIDPIYKWCQGMFKSDAPPRTTSIKKWCYVSHTNLAMLLSRFLLLSVKTIPKRNLGQSETWEKKSEKKIAVVVHVLWASQNLVISRWRFAEEVKEMYKELYHVHNHWNLLFSDVPAAVTNAVVVFLNSLIGSLSKTRRRRS